MNHEFKKFRYEGLLPSVKNQKLPNFVTGCFSIF